MAIRTGEMIAPLLLALGFASAAAAQGTPIHIKEEQKGMLKMAKVTPADAIKTAQARFPDATLKSGEIEKEHGKLIYSFDLQRPGARGIEEVNVDAGTGAVVNTEHENPAPPKKPARKPPLKKPPAG